LRDMMTVVTGCEHAGEIDMATWDGHLSVTLHV
jgi:hypothetical protein